jgi:hypothetical protein
MFVSLQEYTGRFERVAACLYAAGEYRHCALLHQAMGDMRRAGTAWHRAGDEKASGKCLASDTTTRREYHDLTRARQWRACADLLARHPLLLPAATRRRTLASAAGALLLRDAVVGTVGGGSSSSLADANVDVEKYLSLLPSSLQASLLSLSGARGDLLERILVVIFGLLCGNDHDVCKHSHNNRPSNVRLRPPTHTPHNIDCWTRHARQ